MPLSVLFAGLLGLALPQSEPAPIPIELALGARRLALADRPTSSPDGKHVAYVVKDMTAANPGARQARYAPTGIPGLGEGCRLYLTETATGKTAEIGPAKGSSIRPSWSPAGDAVAFYSDAGGKAQLWIYSVKDGKARRAGDARVRAHLWPGDEPAFARDGKSVIVGLYPERLDVRSSGPEGAEPRRGPEVHASGGDEAEAPADGGALERHFDRENAIDVASIDLESGAARVLVSSLVKPAPAVARLSPTGRFVSYLTVFRAKSEASVEAAFDLVVLDAAAKKEVFKAEALDVDERDTFGLAYRWHPREDRLYFVKDKRVWEADLTGASGLTQAKVEPRVLAKGLGDVDAGCFGFTPDGGTAVFGLVGSSAPQDTREGIQNLASVSLGKGPLMTLAAPAPWQIRSLLTDARGVLWRPKGTEVRAFARDAATGEAAILALDAATGAARVVVKGRFTLRTFAFDDASGAVLAVKESLESPEAFVKLDNDGKETAVVARIDPRLEGIAVGESASFTTTVVGHDGMPRAAQTTVLLPPGVKPGDRPPAVAVVYGGVRLTRRSSQFGGGEAASMPAAVFTTRGYALILLDGLISPDGSKGNPVSELRDAVVPQIARAAELGLVNGERVAVMGQSYGGYGAAALLTATPVFRAGIAVSGMYDLPGSYARMDPGGGAFGVRWSESGQGRMGDTPWNELRRYLDNSPYYRLDKLSAPLLLVHGEQDDVCPVSEARKMLNGMRRLKKPGELLVYPGEGHAVSEWSEASAKDAIERILAFLGREVRGDR